MTHTDRTPSPLCRTSARLGGALAMLLLAGLLFAGAASATFEQVDTFGDEAGNLHLYRSGGAAVNVSGAGGVPAGSLYTGGSFAGTGVSRWGPKGELLGHWGGFLVAGIAVDQATGNVYVLEERHAFINQNQIEVYNADGSELITSFGELAATGETVSQDPGKIHGVRASGIAVSNSGTVYIEDTFIDSSGQSPVTTRVMVFEPQSPGDFSHYVYAGQSNDVAVGKLGEELAIDAANNLYAVTEEGVSIEEYDPASPNTPICRYETPSRQGGILGMTVDPIRGEVFYFSYKDTKIHQLSACSEGKFKETAKFAATPKPEVINALAFNPSLAWDGARPAGVLYGADRILHGTEGAEHGQGYIFAAPPAIPPQVEAESIAGVTATTATIRAQINPKGSPTRYAFQYETEAAYQANEPADRFAGAIEVPLGGAALGSGQEALSAAAALSGLGPDSGYRFRAIATSHCNPDEEEELCEDIGPGQAFHTFPLQAPGLPDDRAWELVSPAQKFGGEVIPSFPNIGSCNECKPGSGFGAGAFPRQSSADGEAVAYEGFPFTFNEGAVVFNEYISRRTPSGWQTTTLSPLLQSFSSSYKAFNTSLTQGLLYQDSPTLSPQAPAEYANLYAQPTGATSTLDPLLLSEPFYRPAGSLSLAFAGASDDLSRIFFAANDALTGETPFAPEAQDGGVNKDNLYEWSGGQLRLVNVLPGNAEAPPGPRGGTSFGFGPASAHAISEDGTRAFWSAPTGQVYVRIDGESTIAIPDPGKFLAASADGSKVLLDNGHLFGLEGEEPTVGEIADLSEGEGDFQGIIGQSEDLSQIYFVDTAVLDEGENDQGAVAQAGKDNLYSWQGGTSSFVATLLPEDGLAGEVGDWVASPGLRTAEASPNGRWAAFLSKAQLSGYDNTNTGPCVLPCAEAFLYDSATGKLTCASCDPSGARPLGPTHLTLIATTSDAVLQPRYLTDTGRLYFDTQDSLTPFDTNSGVEDVYQYEPEGIGGCERAGGCVNLISAGHEAVDSNFVTMDPSGQNVFFTSRDQLVLKDKDELVDLYDARENGGIPSETEVARSECQGEACQAAIVPPNDPTPGSSSFEGAGNVDEEKATKKHKHKKHKHAKHKSSKRAHGRANHNHGGAK